MLQIILWVVGVYLALGILVTIMLSSTPYSDNGWLVTTALWPMFVAVLIF